MTVLLIVNEKTVNVNELKKYAIKSPTVNQIVKKASERSMDSNFSPNVQVANV